MDRTEKPDGSNLAGFFDEFDDAITRSKDRAQLQIAGALEGFFSDLHFRLEIQEQTKRQREGD